jgi:hypothetical protein
VGEERRPRRGSVSTAPERPPALDPERVQAFVIAAHGDLDAVRKELAAEKSLVNATWDWGGGDFESALGGAAHMGRRDIALVLLEHGARLDIFAAAMLGDVEIVSAMLEAHPALRDTPGPHGIPLLAHAKAGGEVAQTVVELLEAR